MAAATTVNMYPVEEGGGHHLAPASSSSSNEREPISSDAVTLAPSTPGENDHDGRDRANKTAAVTPVRPGAGKDGHMQRQATEYMTAEDIGELHRQLSRHISRSSTTNWGSEINPESESFELEPFLKSVFRRTDESGVQRRETNVVFEDLCVDGIGSGVTFGDTVGSIFLKPIEMIKNIRRKPVKHILQGFSGTVEPGEMLLVLGRPGAGCSSFLKTLANNTNSFSAVTGDRSYSGISAKEMEKHFAGDVAYLPEDDIHLPVLTVDQTLEFAAASRAPAKQSRLETREEYVKTLKAVMLAIFGLRHTVDTKVGGDYVRGISGGQRKRVSIAELIMTRAKVACHDNSTRGLDASTSLEYVQSLRVVADIARVTTVVSIYQAAESLYKLFDKVCLIYEGRMIYYGPRQQAAEYFHSLGYEPQPRQTTPDFLCSITDPNARVETENFNGYRPKTSEEFAKAFLDSQIGKENLHQVSLARSQFSAEGVQNYRESAKKEVVTGVVGGSKKKHNDVGDITARDHAAAGGENGEKGTGSAGKKAGKSRNQASPYVISYWQQTKLCIRRRVQLALGDLPSLLIPIIVSIINAIIIGSTFFRIPDSTIGFFSRGGVIFFAILFNAFQAMAEIPSAYTQRPVIVRQRRYAMVHPSCDALAQVLVDFPVKFVVIAVFDVILYFFTNLSTRLASQFWIFFLFTYVVTLAMIAFFRALAAVTRAESTATLFAGLGILVFVIYAGYAIPRPSMKVWFRWLSYAHPISFGFEAMLTNEMRAYTQTPCANLVPANAPSVANQVCAIAGSVPGSATVNANDYLAINNGYYYSNTWRNLGIVLAFWILFLFIQLVATEFQEDVAERPAVIVYKRGKAPKEIQELMKASGGNDSEKNVAKDAGQLVGENRTDDNEQEQAAQKLESASDVFLFKNVCYDVPTKDGMTRLLNQVNGYVAPGKLTALMGESGAGKTTLLNVLAQRVTTGVVTGDMLVNGRPLPTSFQRQTGYCQQQDVHMATQTVREALEFSALLRQPSTVPKAEKIAYVDTVIKMLEMESFQHALVGEVGEGLNVEQRKRLTIGVELAAKPALLLFADEPTSGLDSQSAWSIVQFLRKLADHGQAILCTIHQPSSELFQVFDRLLLLKKGGKTAYFGDIGKNSETLIKYFERQSGKKCGEQDNPAEYILECVGAGATAKVSEDWGQLWQDSEERKKSDEYVAKLESDYKGKKSQADEAPDAGRSYAAPVMTQLTVVTHRAFQNYWRDPTYVFGKLALNIFAGLFIGFSFWMAPANQQGLQVYLFSVFMAIVLAGSLAQQIQPKFIALRALYEVRERPSRMYNWGVQTFVSVIVEIPWNIFAGSLFFFCWYWTVGNQNGGRAIYGYLTYAIAFELYWQTFAQAVAAFSPNGMIASIIFSFLFSFVIVFNGVLQPPDLLPYFWRSWMFPLTPFRYLVGGLLANSLGGVQLTCTPQQVQYLNPPAGVGTCQDYLGQYVASATGFLTNPNAVGQQCGYCQYGTGDEYLQTVQASYSDRWRNFGILWIYIFFNLFIVFAMTWVFRIHDWSRKSKSSNPKAVKKDEPQQVQQGEGATENQANEPAGATAGALPIPGATTGRKGDTVTSGNTDRQET